MKILVPIDGSSYSENSLEFVASRATLLGKNPEIELLVVLAPLPTRAARLVSKDSLMRYYEDEAEKIFKPARKFLKTKGVEVTEAFIVGDPAEKIAEEATKLPADLIIMGSRGRTALAGRTRFSFCATSPLPKSTPCASASPWTARSSVRPPSNTP